MRGLILAGVIRPGRPVTVVLREAWERSMVCASAKDEQGVLEQLSSMHEEFETEAEQAGRN